MDTTMLISAIIERHSGIYEGFGVKRTTRKEKEQFYLRREITNKSDLIFFEGLKLPKNIFPFRGIDILSTFDSYNLKIDQKKDLASGLIEHFKFCHSELQSHLHEYYENRVEDLLNSESPYKEISDDLKAASQELARLFQELNNLSQIVLANEVKGAPMLFHFLKYILNCKSIEKNNDYYRAVVKCYPQFSFDSIKSAVKRLPNSTKDRFHIDDTYKGLLSKWNNRVEETYDDELHLLISFYTSG